MIVLLIFIGFLAYRAIKKGDYNPKYSVGQSLDSLHGVIGNVEGRNLSSDGYNLGLKSQCVEFVKLYYYEYYNHRMPDSYGNAKDFFNKSVKDGAINPQRELFQFSNPSKSKPQVSDLIIFGGTAGNKYGHVAIISNVATDSIKIIQQNPGPFGKPRVKLGIKKNKNLWSVESKRILGWLRINKKEML